MDPSQAIYHRTSLLSLLENLLAAIQSHHFSLQPRGCEGQVAVGPCMHYTAHPLRSSMDREAYGTCVPYPLT